ncbi:MAG: hypothetical protein ACYC56_12325 [Candidatus Aquicultor sp.]
MFEVRKPGIYDFVLAMATILILVGLSAVSIYGTIESWVNSIQDPNWTSTLLYGEYLGRMNAYAYPFVIALVLVLCMCIPKRFIPRSYLLQLSLVLLAICVGVSLAWGLVAGLGLLLIASLVIQMMVVMMLLARSGSLVFEREGPIVQLGSALLHLGFVVFALDILLIKDMQNHVNVFWFATVLITGGTVLSFYSRELALAFRGRRGRQAEADDDFENGPGIDAVEY